MIILSKSDVNKAIGHNLSDPLVRLYLNRGGKSKIMELPICPKCEKVGLRTKGWAKDKIMVCPSCGFQGKAICKFSAYLNEGCYK